MEKNLKIKNIVSRNKVQNSLKDILKVEDNSKILEIFKVDIEVKNVETKMSFNKLLAKAEVEICLLYLDDNKCVRKINSSFPLMTFIDVQNSSDNYMVDIDYIVRNVFFKIQNEGESVEFQIDFEIQSVLYEEKEIKVIEDVYSLTKVLDVESKCVNLEMITNDEIENLVKINETYKIDNMKNLLGSEINVYKVNQKEILVILKENDVIVSVYSKPVKTIDDFQFILMGHNVGTVLKCKYLCSSENIEKETLIYLEKRSKEPVVEIYKSDYYSKAFIPFFGLELIPTSSSRKKSFMVKNVIRGTAADELGFSENDKLEVGKVKLDNKNKFLIAQVSTQRKKKGFMDISLMLSTPYDCPYYF